MKTKVIRYIVMIAPVVALLTVSFEHKVASAPSESKYAVYPEALEMDKMSLVDKKKVKSAVAAVKGHVLTIRVDGLPGHVGTQPHWMGTQKRSPNAPVPQGYSYASNFIFEVDVRSMRPTGLQLITSEASDDAPGDLVLRGDPEPDRPPFLPDEGAIEMELVVRAKHEDQSIKSQAIVRTRSVGFWIDTEYQGHGIELPLEEVAKPAVLRRRAQKPPYVKATGWTRPRFEFPVQLEPIGWLGIVIDLPAECNSFFEQVWNGGDDHEPLEIVVVHGRYYPPR